MARKRADSAHERANAFAATDLPIPAHVKLRERDLPFWNAIVRARARDLWTDIDLNHAANLARCQADIERIQAEIDIEGDTLTNDRGTIVMNPKHSLLETLSRRSIALCRTLQVHAIATVGESKQSRGKNSSQREAQRALESSADDDLLAAPLH
ncbi:hypothetical protein [Enterococcus faecalis]|jgi:hypothetical protein|uniref:hypothetical protein n=1 Tax=Enterococcus faecalis TaxID=1351 RepID=UPI003CE4C3E4